uniref:Uncharacterized protein n=1 Tax=Odontella aurita TaxID=265563 RepID=A0A7S4NAR7_9STRA|mmetsp:Transcript_55101/g.165051  ORF Transcript_55101/g.165051 Transcript_55101/m.165051 type:complete len:116 (+) Transcript_55101:528-875(+)
MSLCAIQFNAKKASIQLGSMSRAEDAEFGALIPQWRGRAYFSERLQSCDTKTPWKVLSLVPGSQYCAGDKDNMFSFCRMKLLQSISTNLNLCCDCLQKATRSLPTVGATKHFLLS